MALTREFIDWSGHLLPAVCSRLWDRRSGSGWDLSGLVISTPSSRAQRILTALLVNRAQDPADGPVTLNPPLIVTEGRLAEELYTLDGDVADTTDEWMAWTVALATLGADDAKRILSSPPDAGSAVDWLPVARQLAALRADAAAAGRTFAQIAPAGSKPALRDARWQVLPALERTYLALLSEAGLKDAYEARSQALRSGALRADREILLLAPRDIKPALADMVRAYALQANVTVCVHAPAAEADAFDDLGRPLQGVWSRRPIPVDLANARIGDDPAAQALEALDALAATGPVDPSATCIAVCDDDLWPALERAMEAAGVPFHAARGRSAHLARPAVLLAALADWASSRTAESFAAIIRHPDIGLFQVQNLTRALDECRHSSAPFTLTGAWPQGASADLEGARTDLNKLVDGISGSRALPACEWAEPLSKMLSAVYERSAPALDRHIPDDARRLRELSAMGDALRALADVPTALCPTTTAAGAVRIIHQMLRGVSIPEQPTPGDMDAVGWLEAQLDTAPTIVLMGLNEGKVPESRPSDPFVPDSLRERLGMACNAERLARDAYILTATLQSRSVAAVTLGRRSSRQDPLLPGRLLLRPAAAGAVERDVEAAARLMSEFCIPTSRVLAPRAQPAAAPATLIPYPVPPPDPATSISVSGIRRYLACPYRYYLAHVLKIGSTDDEFVELDAMTFGNLLHGALSRYSSLPDAPRTDDEIELVLEGALDQTSASTLGSAPSAIVGAQVEIARRRLRAVASVQARLEADGWRTVSTESAFAAPLVVDGQPISVRGRVDRIDYHEATGVARIVDYKSRDRAASPSGSCTGDGNWIDLQLPLYQFLAPSAGFELPGPINRWEAGYFAIPGEARHCGWKAAAWSDEQIDSAIETARSVVRGIRQGIFWPPANPDSNDGLNTICLDGAPDRLALIRASTPGEVAL